MKKIITVTLNPCVDKYTEVSKLIPAAKLSCTPPLFQPGGGGINVARVLQKLGAKPRALFVAGGSNGQCISEMLKMEKVRFECIKINAPTRENFMVHEGTTGCQFRFGLPGAPLEKKDWMACLAYVKIAAKVDFVVASGSLPPGAPVDLYGRLAQIVAKKGAKLIVDTAGEPLHHLQDKSVYLLKPNVAELCQLVGKEHLSRAALIETARHLVLDRWCEVLVVSLGKEGALLVTGTTHSFIAAPQVSSVNAVGSGDSMVAGIVYGLAKGYTLKKAIQTGVACGAAATLQEGFARFSKKQVSKLFAGMVNTGEQEVFPV